MNDTITKEQVLNAYNSAPDLVRVTFNDEKTTQIIMGLQARFKLHADNAGLLGKSVGYMLLGLMKPEDFLQKLITAEILDTDARQIVTEINQNIFVPLREEMRKAVMSQQRNQQPPKPAAPVIAPRPMGVPPAPAAGAGQPTSHFHLENKLPPRPAVASGVMGPPPRPAESVAVRPIPPRPSAQVPVAAAALRTPVPALPQQPPRPLQSVTPITKADASVGSPTVFASGPKSVNILSIAPLPPKIVLPRAIGTGLRSGTQSFSKSMDSSKLLEDHEEPHIDISNKVQVVSSETPLQQALRTVLPPPPNLPGAMPPRVVPEVRPSPTIPKVEPPVQKVPQAPVKPYSADPYREPIE